MKVYEETAIRAAELVVDIRLHNRADGVVTPQEQAIEDAAHEVYRLAEETALRAKLAQRVAGGGDLDRNLRREWDELSALRPTRLTSDYEEDQAA